MSEFIVGIEYCGLPRCCGTCGIFGHDYSLAPPGTPNKRVWRRKRSKVLVLGQPEVVGTNEKEVVPVLGQPEVEGATVKEVIQVTEEEAVAIKGKKVMEDTTPPVTPSALPSQEEFNNVINGAKPKSALKVPTPILNSNAFDLLCGQRDIILQAPPKKGGRDGLRSKVGTTKVVLSRK
ncbi:unnamed protein product [Linum trigynum]|uniref:Uncharacterized protein n=1 Tax=Linum trigynum TaxID=586398 RepID=A0AAV2GAU8_9ROSI